MPVYVSTARALAAARVLIMKGGPGGAERTYMDETKWYPHGACLQAAEIIQSLAEDRDALEKRIQELETQQKADRENINLKADAIENWINTSAGQHDEIQKLKGELAAEKQRADGLPEMALATVVYELSCTRYDDACEYASGKYMSRMVQLSCQRKEEKGSKT